MGFGIINQLKYLTPTMLMLLAYRAYLLRKFKGMELYLGLGSKLVNCSVGKRVYISVNTKLYDATVGDHSYFNRDSEIRCAKIGRFCSIGPDVKIGLGDHAMNMVSTHPAFYSKDKPFTTFSDKNYFKEYEETIIGNDVWLGEGVRIPGGVKIGDGAVIAARAVVTRDVEPYALVGGVPARFIRYRFDEHIRKQLLQIKWWDKDLEWLKENFLLFQDPETFVKVMSRSEHDRTVVLSTAFMPAESDK